MAAMVRFQVSEIWSPLPLGVSHLIDSVVFVQEQHEVQEFRMPLRCWSTTRGTDADDKAIRLLDEVRGKGQLAFTARSASDAVHYL